VDEPYAKITREDWDEFRDLLVLLPETEQKTLYYFFVKRMGQKEIADFFGISQGAVSSRLKRAKKRMLYFKVFNEYHWEETFDKDLEPIFDPLDMEVLRHMAKTGGQTQTAIILNGLFNFQGEMQMNQVKIRYRFEKCLKKLKEKGLLKYYNFFMLIKKNMYVNYEIKLPHFDHLQLAVRRPY
jgi:predicted DNA-binding protein YlxM (UPF0122 family)